MGGRSKYRVEPGAVLYLLSRATRPLSVRVISRDLLGGMDRSLKGLKVVLGQLIAEGKVKAIRVQKNHQQYEHYIIGHNQMAEYQIQAKDKGTTVKTVIITDDPARAVRFTKLLAASGKWDSVQVRANRTVYTLETLGDLT